VVLSTVAAKPSMIDANGGQKRKDGDSPLSPLTDKLRRIDAAESLLFFTQQAASSRFAFQ
jgi:hypothetical protein